MPPPQQIDNTTFTPNNSEIEMSTTLPIEEEIIFPPKYLNEAEENPDLNF